MCVCMFFKVLISSGVTRGGAKGAKGLKPPPLSSSTLRKKLEKYRTIDKKK